MTRVVFIEDRSLMLEALKHTIPWQENDIEPIGFFSSCDEALPQAIPSLKKLPFVQRLHYTRFSTENPEVFPETCACPGASFFFCIPLFRTPLCIDKPAPACYNEVSQLYDYAQLYSCQAGAMNA